MRAPLCRSTWPPTPRLLRGFTWCRLCSFCPGGSVERSLKGNVTGGRRKARSGRTVCRTVLDHFDREYGEQYEERWLNIREVMLTPSKWQYAALPNLFALQQRRQQSYPEHHHSQHLPEAETQCYTQHLDFTSHDSGNAPSCNGNFISKAIITASVSPQLDVDLDDNTWVTGSCASPQMAEGPKVCAIHTTCWTCASRSESCPSGDRSKANENEKPKDKIARRDLQPCSRRDHAFREAVYLSAAGIVDRTTREEGLGGHFRETFLAGPRGPMPVGGGVAGLWCFMAQTGRPFPKLRHEPGLLKAFYVLNAASLLPVLALGVRSGERVLDMCAAPGGKTLGILQCSQPSLLCANEPDEVRRRRLLLALESFVPQGVLRSIVTVSALDGRQLGGPQPMLYDKVLVDAPCSNDRSWLYSGNETLAELRIHESAHLPGLQTQLLRSALRAVKPGGIVVYATCTLNVRENAGVVRAALEGGAGIDAEIVDLVEMARGLQGVFSFIPGSSGDNDAGGEGKQPGLLVVPEVGRAWGPLYLCKMRRRS